MPVPRAFLSAIFKYAPIVQGVAKQYGINGRQLLARLAKGESNFNMGAVSSAGARGGTQFMPETRADYLRRYGVDAWKNPDQAIHATALYLRGGGGLQSYNPGMPSYTNYILGQRVGNLAKQLRGQGGAVPAGVASGPSFARMSNVTPAPGNKVSQLMEIFARMNQSLPTPQQPLSGSPYPNLGPTQQDFANNYKLIAQLGKGGSAPSGRLANYAGGSVTKQGTNKVQVAGTANRAGVGIQKIVFNFLNGLGENVTIGTGTNHNRMTVNGNVSDHWDGHAADIPAAGGHLIELGQRALIRAGMPPAEARKQQGGLYNLQWHGHRVQVIFNTQEGGDHTDHLHVGIR